MLHARPDYMRIQDPGLHDPALLGPGCTPIAEEEPVVLFRAQDKHMKAVLTAYILALAEDQNTRPDIIESVTHHILRVSAWQQKNPPKTPDLPL